MSEKWGYEQTITGLVLTVPYYIYSKVYNERTQEQKEKGEKASYEIVRRIEYAYFLPNELNIYGTLSPEVRYRGIYEVIVYNTNLNLKGSFSSLNFSEWNIDKKDVLLENATISLGLSDLRSIQNSVSLNWNKKLYSFNPGVLTTEVVKSGISTKVPIDLKDSTTNQYYFDVAIDFNGSSGINFVPLGKETNVKLESSWNSPSFIGAFLPDYREVNTKGFTSSWNILHLNRPYPQQFLEVNGHQITASSFGVDLLMPVGEYQKSTRSVKYASLFITLTFLIFFFVQILNKVRIHPIQYIMVGLALCIFYTLLVALSEHISFMYAYLLASSAIIITIVAYTKAFFQTKLSMIVGGILVILYGFIFTIIQLQDYALLIGSIGLFVVLATVMFLSRKINWYQLNVSKKDNTTKQSE